MHVLASLLQLQPTIVLGNTNIATAAFVRVGRLINHASSAWIFSILNRRADMSFRIAVSESRVQNGKRRFFARPQMQAFGAPGGRENDVPVIM